ncbi:MAG TPA: glycosyltransferase family 4 protein [Thermoanaerobaculia bacterium]|nr:glycosyltransferase family 4 protein [Thermoanaerobaculia bacterium]
MARRILMLSHHGRSVSGGAPLADLSLAQGLSGLGHTVDLLFFDDLLPASVRATWRQLLFPWACALAFLRRGGAAGYDVVESTAGDAWLIALLLGLSRRRPLLSIRTHGLEPRRAEMDLERLRREGRPLRLSTRLYHFRFRLWEVARDLRAGDAVFVLNQEDAAYATERMGLPPERIHTLPNGLPDELLRLGDPEPSPERAFRLLFLGAWSAAKGADLLPGIARELFRRDPRYTLTCAGVGETEAAVLADFAPEACGRVQVIPRYGRPELPGILAGHGVFLFPSPAEGCSLALLEAMAGGLAPVTTRTGYAADFIAPGRDGLLVEAGDATGFTEAVLSLAADPRLALDMGRSARRAVAGHSWPALAAERVRIWESLPNRGGSKAGEPR